jgi:hypothetical protein
MPKRRRSKSTNRAAKRGSGSGDGNDAPAKDAEPAPVPPPEHPWDRQPGEPDLWWSRFRRFLGLGPRRSLLAAWRAELAESGREVPNGSNPSAPDGWSQHATQWAWRERAAAFDDHDRDRLEQERRDELDRRRREVFSVEWSEARALLDRAHRLEAEADGLPCMGKTRSTGTEAVEQADGGKPVERTISTERDAHQLLALARAYRADALALMRKAAHLPANVPGDPEDGERSRGGGLRFVTVGPRTQTIALRDGETLVTIDDSAADEDAPNYDELLRSHGPD